MSAGDGFFLCLVRLSSFRGNVASAFHKVVDLRNVVNIGDQVYHAVLGAAVLDYGVENIFIGELAKIAKVALVYKVLTMMACGDQFYTCPRI